MLVREWSEGTEEGVLDLKEEVKATQNKVNDHEGTLVDQHPKDTKVNDTFYDLEKELKSY